MRIGRAVLRAVKRRIQVRQPNATKAANMAKRMTVAMAIPHSGSSKIANAEVDVASLAASSTDTVGRTAIGGGAAGFFRDAAGYCVTAKRDFMIEILLVTWATRRARERAK